MIVDSRIVTHLLESYGVEVAREGFVVCTPSLTVCLVDGTVAATVVVAGEDTVLAIDDTCHQFTYSIGIDHSLILDDSLRLSAQFVPNNVGSFFQSLHLVEADRGSGIALNAAGTLAGGKIATELHLEDVERDECVLNFDHGVLLTIDY